MIRKGADPLRLFLTLLSIGAVSIIPERAASKGTPQADLTLKDVSGQRVRLRDYRGKVVVLNFWATWCSACNDEMPMLVEAEKEYRSKGVVFVAASLDDSKTKDHIPAFLSKYQVGFPVWVGATADDLDKLALGEAVPATAFLDKEGHVAGRVLGQMRKPELVERVEWLTGNRSGPAPAALVNHLGAR